MPDRWLYLFRLASAGVRDAVITAWTAGSLNYVAPGSTLRTWSAAGQHWAAVEIAAPDGQTPAFDQHIPSGTTHQLVQSGPLYPGDDPYAQVDLTAIALSMLGPKPPVVFGGA